MMPANILLIQLGDIGDVVLTTSAIRAVKETHPGARVSILVRKPYGGLLGGDPHLHQVIEHERIRGPMLRRLRGYIAFARTLRRSRYDLVIDLRTGDLGAILSFLTRAPVRVGCREPRKNILNLLAFSETVWNLTPAPASVHPGADQTLRFVRHLGMDSADSAPKIYVAPSDRDHAAALLADLGLHPNRKWASLNAYSRWKYKEWSNGKWGEVIDHLWEAHRMPTVLVGSAEDACGYQEIVASRTGRVFNLAGKTSLGELAAIISMSSLHFGVDSAAPHIAAAVMTATVTIHGPSDWRGWRRANEQNRVVTPDMDCVPCNRMGCNNSGQSRCLDQLAASAVTAAADSVLATTKQVIAQEHIVHQQG